MKLTFKFFASFFIFILCNSLLFADTQSLRQSARKAAQAKKYEDALELYSQIIEQNPDDIRTLNIRSLIYNNMDLYYQAMKDSKRVLELGENNVDALNLLAHSYFRIGNVAEAAALTDKALKIDPKNKVALENNKTYTTTKNYSAPSYFEYIEKRIQKNPKSGILHNAYGYCWFGAGEYEKAEAAYKKSLTLLKKGFYYCDSLVNLGCVYIAKQDFQKAKECLEKAVKNRKNNSEAYAYLALAYDGLENTESALKAANKAVELSPGNIIYHYNRGTIYSELGKLNEAIEEFNYCESNGLLRSPIPKAEFYSWRAGTYCELNKIDEAIADYSRAIQFDNTDVDSYENRFLLYVKQEQYEKACADLDRLIELTPERSEGLLRRKAELQKLIK